MDPPSLTEFAAPVSSGVVLFETRTGDGAPCFIATVRSVTIAAAFVRRVLRLV